MVQRCSGTSFRCPASPTHASRIYNIDCGDVRLWPKDDIYASLLIELFGKEMYCAHNAVPDLSPEEVVEYEAPTSKKMEGVPVEVAHGIDLLMLLEEHRLTEWC